MKNSKKVEELRNEIQLLGEMFERANSMFKRIAISGRIAGLESELRKVEKES